MMKEDEISTVDKENKTPNSLLLRSINKIGKSAEFKHPKSYQSLPLNKAEKCYINQQREKYTRKVLQEQKSASSASKSRARLVKEPTQVKCRADKSDPFQSLLVTSTILSSLAHSWINSALSLNCNYEMLFWLNSLDRFCLPFHQHTT
ncbi:unnamed protein product [Fraxinus pennsylvanica]|uniref:Uncharacterized protein n=1 Tax=Fraxinus pennsylvanica TaxID=56036 RepID=A0AAD2AFE9_9LAMI|nr:unnamed protein product [Fraxinus pennsylvanica]